MAALSQRWKEAHCIFKYIVQLRHHHTSFRKRGWPRGGRLKFYTQFGLSFSLLRHTNWDVSSKTHFFRSQPITVCQGIVTCFRPMAIMSPTRSQVLVKVTKQKQTLILHSPAPHADIFTSTVIQNGSILHQWKWLHKETQTMESPAQRSCIISDLQGEGEKMLANCF